MLQALQRECREEINCQVEVGDILYIREYIGRNHEFSAVDSDINYHSGSLRGRAEHHVAEDRPVILRIDTRVITEPVVEDAGLQHPHPTSGSDVIDTPLPSPPPEQVAFASGKAVAGYQSVGRSLPAETVPKLPGHPPILPRVRLEVEIPDKEAGSVSCQFFVLPG